MDQNNAASLNSSPNKKKANKKKKDPGQQRKAGALTSASDNVAVESNGVSDEGEKPGSKANGAGNGIANPEGTFTEKCPDEDADEDTDETDNEDSDDAAEGTKEKASDSTGNAEIEAVLREELEKERSKSKELEIQLDDLRKKKLAEKPQPLATPDAAIQPELQNERIKRQELEKEISTLKAEWSAHEKERSELRNSLEEEKEYRKKESEEADKRVAQITAEKKTLEMQYKNLLGRVSTIKSTLGERLKADAEELAQTRSMVADLEEQNRTLNQTIDGLRSELEKLNDDGKHSSNELASLRNRLNLSQQNWQKERDDMIIAERNRREEFESLRQAAQDWEVIAMEERSVRESLSDRVIELEEQLANMKVLCEKVSSERDKESHTVDGLQRALQDIQDARKKELRETVESMQTQIDQLTTKSLVLERRSEEAETQLTAAKADLERVLPFEKEVREKNLLIGKLRHEAVTLNDHLRKALRMLKRDNADDKIDKQLVTNVFLSFVSIQRGDAKKYEVLQLIASVLDWNDEQREKAGLVRPGTAANSANNTLKTPPLSPFHRSPSTPSLTDAYEGSKDLWTSVLGSDKA
ncbi:hypothetical protein RUND412_003140 [Rhizina undulata]